LPTPLLWQFFGQRGPHLIELWTKMDILQCVAGSLAIILLLVLAARTPQIHRGLCAALGVIAATSAVPVTRWIAGGVEIPKPLLNYLWPTGIGVFPLVPWAGFPLLAVMLGPAIFSETSRPRQCLRALLAGLFMLVAAHFMVAGRSYDAPFVFGRMGCLLIALGACVWLDAPCKGTGWILQFGELSLWSYTVHLVIVYGSCVSLGLDSLGARFSPAVVFVALTVVLFITASVVNWRAKNLQRRAAVRIMPAK